MRPRTEMTAFSNDLPFKELLRSIVANGYSRVPVYEETPDRVVGLLYIKDVLPHIHEPEFNWTMLLRPAYFVPETKKLDELLKDFQRNTCISPWWWMNTVAPAALSRWKT